MKVVVTGGAGFIGSHLIDRLAHDQVGEILVLDNLFRGRPENLAAHQGNPQIQLVEHDIRNGDALRSHFDGADTVYHLAAQSNVMGAVTDVGYSFGANVVGTFNVLQAAQAAGVRRVVFTSSREVYGEAQNLPVGEDHPLNAKNTYGASKAAGELYAKVFHTTFGLETAVLRLANVYGSRDFGRVIPLWLTAAREGRDLVVFGGEQLIDFVWVDQVVEALIRASTADIIGTPINVGSGQGTSILDLAQCILTVSNATAKLDRQPARSAEVAKFEAKIDLMRSLLRLEPPTDPLFGLEQLVGHY